MEREASALWLAELLLKGNRLLGSQVGLCDSEKQRACNDAYTRVLVLMASGAWPGRSEDERSALVQQVVASMSAHRRAISTRLRAAAMAGTIDTNLACSFAVLDWMLAAADEHDATGLPSAPAGTLRSLERGAARLRTVLEDLSSLYTDVAHTPRAIHAMEQLTGPAAQRLVRSALTAQALGGLFDGVRLAAGARVNHAVFGVAMCADVARAVMGRADAYAAMRLYTGLQTVVALLMMGAAAAAQRVGDRGAWAQTPLGQAALAYRRQVGEALAAYDTAKRAPCERAGRTYIVQTPGCVAALQEQAAALAMKLQYESDEGLLGEALAVGLGEAALFDPAPQLDATRGDEGEGRQRLSFWSAVDRISRARPHCWEGGADGRQAPMHVAMQQTWAAIVFARADPATPTLLQPTSAMSKAMAQAVAEWPTVEHFYGKDYAETERKVQAKATKEGRDPLGRETGEAFGYRLDWMGYLAHGTVRRPQAVAPEPQARMRAAITALAMAEAFAADGVGRVLPIASGNAVHYVHTVGAAKEPTQLALAYRAELPLTHTLLLERSDPHNAAHAEAPELSHAERKRALVERVVERVAPPYRASSGAALITELYHDFFAEVWRRFNDNLRNANSPWAAKLARWEAHYAAHTTPPRTDGEAKLIHPWRVMALQQGVARALLAELYGEREVLKQTDGAERAAMRIYRALLNQLVTHMDYAPWASHLVRRFCSMEEHRTKRRRLDAEAPAPAPAPPPKATRPVSPSLLHPPRAYVF